MPPITDPSTLTGRSRADPGGADPGGGQPGQGRRAAAGRGEQPDRPVVLVVEDELLVAMLLRFILENLGYSVCALARSAPDAVAAAERPRPDGIMMDIRLADDTDRSEERRVGEECGSKCKTRWS